MNLAATGTKGGSLGARCVLGVVANALSPYFQPRSMHVIVQRLLSQVSQVMSDTVLLHTKTVTTGGVGEASLFGMDTSHIPSLASLVLFPRSAILLGRRLGLGLALADGPTRAPRAKNGLNDIRHALALAHRREQRRARLAHDRGVAAHDVERGTDVRGEIGLRES